MTPQAHPTSNAVFASNDPAVAPLPATTGKGTITTYWEPSQAEVAAIAAGQPIKLTTYSPRTPPVSVEVEAPPDKGDVSVADIWEYESKRIPILPPLKQHAETLFLLGVARGVTLQQTQPIMHLAIKIAKRVEELAKKHLQS